MLTTKKRGAQSPLNYSSGEVFSVNVIASVFCATPSTVAVTINSPCESEVNFTVAPPALPVLDEVTLNLPPVVDQLTVAPSTGELPLV